MTLIAQSYLLLFYFERSLYMNYYACFNYHKDFTKGQNLYCEKRNQFSPKSYSKVRRWTMGSVRPWPGAIMCNNYARSTLVGSITPSFSLCAHTHTFFQITLRFFELFFFEVRLFLNGKRTCAKKATAKTNRKTVWVISIPVFFKQSNVLQFVTLPFFFNGH